jgi:hypothetical protein
MLAYSMIPDTSPSRPPRSSARTISEGFGVAGSGMLAYGSGGAVPTLFASQAASCSFFCRLVWLWVGSSARFFLSAAKRGVCDAEVGFHEGLGGGAVLAFDGV